jgi:hypothetical protein
VVKDKTIVRAKSLEVKLAAANGKLQVVFGECTLDVGDLPSRESAISASREGTALGIASSLSPLAAAPANGTHGSSNPPPHPKHGDSAGEGVTAFADGGEGSESKKRASSSPPGASAKRY